MPNDPKRLNPLESSAEILDYARDFFNQVCKGDVSSPESAGGGYALSSKRRKGYHIGTTTAPIALSQQSEILLERIKNEGTRVQIPEIARNLEETLSTLQKAYHMATGKESRLPASDLYFIKGNLNDGLKDMQTVVARVQALAR